MSQATSQVQPAALPASVRTQRKSYGFFEASLRRFLASKLNIASLVLFMIIVVISLTAPLISSEILGIKDPSRALSGLRSPYYAPPGTTERTSQGVTVVHWLGTDEIGRDMLARLIAAGSTSLSVAFLVTIVSLAIGVPLGLLAGFYGGWVDDVINLIVQIFLNIPSFYILIIVLGLFRPTVLLLSILLALFGWMGTTRQVRGLVLSLRSYDFVTASRSMGASPWRLMSTHIFPNLASIVLVITGFDIVGAILSESSLSYLGIGVQEPEVSWGKLLLRSSTYLVSAENKNPILIMGPGIMIFLTTLAIFLIADGLRDAFDPKTKE